MTNQKANSEAPNEPSSSPPLLPRIVEDSTDIGLFIMLWSCSFASVQKNLLRIEGAVLVVDPLLV